MPKNTFTAFFFFFFFFNLLQPVHLITTDVNEQGVAAVQLTENKRTHQLRSGFRRQFLCVCVEIGFVD